MMIRRFSLLLAVTLTCSASAFAQAPSTAALPDAPGLDIAPPATPSGPTVLIDTTMGRLTCQLFDKEAPVASANFIGLATGTKEFTDPVTQKKTTGVRFYDGVTFHRVIPGFMIQGGDRLGTGLGDGGYFFDNETSPSLRFDIPGRLAMANAGANTNGTQFFITEAAHPELNGGYTIFGQCDPHTVLMVASIARVPRNSEDKPLSPVTINKVTIVPVGGAIPADPSAAPAAAAPPTP